MGREEVVHTLGQLRRFPRSDRRLSALLFDDEAVPRIHRQVMGITEAEYEKVPCQEPRAGQVDAEAVEEGTDAAGSVQRVQTRQESGRMDSWKPCHKDALPPGVEGRDHGRRPPRQPENMGLV